MKLDSPDSNSAPRVWVTGAGGLIGSHLVRAASQLTPQLSVIPLTRDMLDLGDPSAVEKKIHQDQPELIIHCAAVPTVAGCQANPALARKINIEATAHLSNLMEARRFIFLSTDLVFDGRKGGYVEEDAPNPLSLYGETKVAAEQSVLQNPKHTVVRLALVYGHSPRGDHSFNEDLQAAWRAGKTVKLFYDEYRGVIPAPAVARAIWELAAQGFPGIYHLAGAERLSRLKIGELVAARCPGLNPKMESSSFRDYQGPPRPPDVSLNCAKLQKLLSFSLPAFSQWNESDL